MPVVKQRVRPEKKDTRLAKKGAVSRQQNEDVPLPGIMRTLLASLDVAEDDEAWADEVLALSVPESVERFGPKVKAVMASAREVKRRTGK